MLHSRTNPYIAGMTRTPEDDMVAKWQRLTSQWQAAYVSYQAAVSASEALAVDPDRSAERASAERQALEELSNIKAQMDEVISKGKARRNFTGDTLVVGTIERPDQRFQNPARRDSRKTEP